MTSVANGRAPAGAVDPADHHTVLGIADMASSDVHRPRNWEHLVTDRLFHRGGFGFNRKATGRATERPAKQE